jgi:hypothetical protein
VTQHNFKIDTVLKKPIEAGFYRNAYENFGVVSNATIVAGPDIIRHIETARSFVARTKASRITIVDNNPSTHRAQKADLAAVMSMKRPPTWMSVKKSGNRWVNDELLTLSHKIDVVYGDVSSIPPSRFIDADLMATVKTCGPTFKKVLRAQREAFKDSSKLKVFIFTFCIRGGGGREKNKQWVLEELIPILGTKVIVGDQIRLTNEEATRRSNKGFMGVTSKEYRFVGAYKSEIIHDLVMNYYHDDGGPMLTGMVIYT